VNLAATTPEPPLRERRAALLLALILCVGLGARVWGVTFGLPFDYHIDESPYSVSALRLELAKISPLFGPYQILLLLELQVTKLLAPLLDRLALPSYLDFAAPNSATIRLLGRLTSAWLGAVTVIPLYLLGKRVWGRKVGLIAALFLALCFFHVRKAHFGVPDSMACLFVVWTVYACTSLARNRTWRQYLWAGLLAGVAIAAKQLTWPLVVTIFLYHAFPERPAGKGPEPSAWARRWFDGKLALAALATVVAFLATSPQVVLTPGRYYVFWKYVAGLGAKGGFERLAVDSGHAWQVYLEALRWGMGDLVLALALAGLVLVAVQRSRAMLVFSFPFIYLAFLLQPGHIFFARYLMPVMPFFALAAAAFLVYVVDRLPVRPAARAAIAAAGLAGALAEPVLAIVRHDVLMTRTDTRTLAKEWIESHVPEGSHVALELWWFSPQLSSTTFHSPLSRRTFEVTLTGPYGLSERSARTGESQGAITIEEYAARGIEYLVTNNLTSGSHMLDPAEERTKRAFYRSLDERTELVAVFSPYAGERRPPRVFEQTYGPATHLDWLARPGPEIKIYRLPGVAPASAAAAGDAR
jgi:dolichyl-phosphate-mannose-protein mannosyltransferase